MLSTMSDTRGVRNVEVVRSKVAPYKLEMTSHPEFDVEQYDLHRFPKTMWREFVDLFDVGEVRWEVHNIEVDPLKVAG